MVICCWVAVKELVCSAQREWDVLSPFSGMWRKWLGNWSVGFDPDIRADVFCTDDQNWQLPPADAQV